MGKLQNKVALVTGGSSGIGLASAELFIAEGAKVVIVGRQANEISSAVARLGANAEGVQGDVSKLEDLDRIYGLVKDRHGRLDVLVASAGVCTLAPLEASTEALFDHHFDINTKGLFFSVQKALPLLSDGAAIVLVSSIAHMKGLRGYHMYAGSKAAVRAFARNWAVELSDRNIRVNCLSPGPTDTPMAGKLGVPADVMAEEIPKLLALLPSGRLGRAEEQAAAVLFLASDDSSFITGSDICTDGGMAQI